MGGHLCRQQFDQRPQLNQTAYDILPLMKYVHYEAVL
jgi:hypothetical protein